MVFSPQTYLQIKLEKKTEIKQEVEAEEERRYGGGHTCSLHDRVGSPSMVCTVLDQPLLGHCILLVSHHMFLEEVYDEATRKAHEQDDE